MNASLSANSLRDVDLVPLDGQIRVALERVSHSLLERQIGRRLSKGARRAGKKHAHREDRDATPVRPSVERHRASFLDEMCGRTRARWAGRAGGPNFSGIDEGSGLDQENGMKQKQRKSRSDPSGVR